MADILERFLSGLSATTLYRRWKDMGDGSVAEVVSVGAGATEIGRTNIKHINVLGTTLTRPANTTAYAANDSISDNATAGNVTANTATLSDANDDPVDITEVLLDTNDAGFANVSVRLRAFTSDNTANSGVQAGDNAAYSHKRAGFAGSFIGTLLSFQDGAKGCLVPEGVPGSPGAAVRIMNVESGGKRIWWTLEVLATATPSGSSTTFTPRFKGYQGRV